jgi:UDP-glucose 4-epimerase
VSDLVQGIALATERSRADGETINLGTQEEISIRDLALLMHDLSEVTGPPSIESVSYEPFPGGREDLLRPIPDTAKSRELLGLEPGTPLRLGARRLWDWFHSERARTARQHADLASS